MREFPARRFGRAMAALALGAACLAAPAAAQPPGPPPGGAGRGGPPPSAEERARLEREFHARVAAIVQRELGLTAEQTRQLEATTRQFEAQRRPLFQRELQIRSGLRQQMRAGDHADAARVDAYLRELLQIQRRRLDVVEAEQRALAGFLTPVQRARFLALQENLRSRVEQQRGRGGRRARAPGAAPGATARPPG